MAGMLKPETRYARSGDVDIAYQVFGEAERHLVLVPGFAGLAEAGEVLVSSTVKDLVARSALAFAERGQHALKGVPGEWRLYAVHRGTSGV